MRWIQLNETQGTAIWGSYQDIGKDEKHGKVYRVLIRCNKVGARTRLVHRYLFYISGMHHGGKLQKEGGKI